MKLKIDDKWQWLGVYRSGRAYFYEIEPEKDGGCWEADMWEYADAFADLEPGALYKRNGEEWERVQ